MAFWQNPEFVRHVRAELRATRAIILAVVALVVCALIALMCWASSYHDPERFFRFLHYWLVGTQFVVLGIWCASSCGQAISRETAL